MVIPKNLAVAAAPAVPLSNVAHRATAAMANRLVQVAHAMFANVLIAAALAESNWFRAKQVVQAVAVQKRRAAVKRNAVTTRVRVYVLIAHASVDAMDNVPRSSKCWA